MPDLLAPAAVFTVTGAIVLLCAPLARRLGLLSRPGGHRIHAGPVPLVGGIAMFSGLMCGFLVADVPPPLLAAAAVLVVTGVLDDLRDLRPQVRFAAQIVAGLIMMAWGHVQLHDLGALLSEQPLVLGDLAAPFTLLAVVGVVNAFNLVDGMDGLAGGIALIALLLLAAATAAGGRTADLGLLMILAAAIAGFLPFNLHYPGHRHASVFMGDAGSLFLGLMLAWCLVDLSQGRQSVIAPVTALWIVALPLLDTISVMMRRLLNGRSPFQADCDHLHHLLHALGLSRGQTVAAMLLMTLLLGTLALACRRLGVPEHWLFAGFCGLSGLYYGSVELGWRRVRMQTAPA